MDEIYRATSATGHAVAYYPDFLANELGFFEDEGLRVKQDAPGHGPHVAQLLKSGVAHIGLGGLWRPLLMRGSSKMMCFAQVADRYNAVLVARGAAGSFAWSDLIGETVLVPSGNPSAYILFQHLVQKGGVDLAQVNFLHTFSGPECMEYFREGLARYLLTGAPGADVLMAEGVAHIATASADAGPLAASVLYATPEFLNRPDNAAGRYTKALERALDWLATHDPTEAPGVFTKVFAGLDPEVLASSVRACRDRGVWSRSARIPVESVMNWQKILIADGSVMKKPLEYAEVVDNRAADWAARESAK